MKTEKLALTFFYSLEKAIKSYRQFAQRNIRGEFGDVTLDQLLVLRVIQDQPEFTQQQIAEAVFKDYASITRIVDLLVRKGLLLRVGSQADRRRSELTLTADGEELMAAIHPMVRNNRSAALKGVSAEELELVKTVMNRIIENCSPNPE